MKTPTVLLGIQCFLVSSLCALAQTNSPLIVPDENPLTPATHNLIWATTPGLRYEVHQSTDLKSRAMTPGFPAPAPGPAHQMPFAAEGQARFFKVRELDEQPPFVVEQYPPNNGFAVPRFASLAFKLSDMTGIDLDSIELTVGALGSFTLSETNLTFENGVLTFSAGGDAALGAWGETNEVSLVIADTLGNRGTNVFRFSLEFQPQVVNNLFVFGSPQAQRTGQRIGNIPAAALARRFGPVPMGEGDPWTLEVVATNRLEISYTNVAPSFALNQYVCNLTPARPEDIFNRRITNIVDDPGNKRLVLFTVEVPLTEFVTNGTASVRPSSVILQTGENGAFSKAFEIGGTITFPRIGYSLDGLEFSLKEQSSGIDIVHFTTEELNWWLTPRVQGSLEISRDGLKRFEAIASGNISSAAVLDVDFLLAGLCLETNLFDLPEASEPKTWLYLCNIGPFPVFASLGFDCQLKARAEAHSDFNLRGGFRQAADASFGLSYLAPDVNWIHDFRFAEPEVIKPSAAITVEGSLTLSLEPKVEFLVYGLAGISAGLTPSLGAIFEIAPGQPLRGRLETGLTFDLEAAGPSFDLARQTFHTDYSLSLPILGPYTLWSFPADPDISFSQQPQSQTVHQGGPAYFYCTASGPGTPSYQWYFNGVLMPGQSSRTLIIPNVNYGHAGNYYVRVSAAGQTANSTSAILTVVPAFALSGLVAYYPFDGNAADASGMHNHANIQGEASFSIDRYGISASALSFDGANDAVVAPASASLNAGTNSGLTLMAWINPNVVNSDRPLIEWNSAAGDYGSHLWILHDGKLYCDIEDTSNHPYTLASASGILQTGIYQHVAVAYNRMSGLLSLYVNGSPVAAKNIGTVAADTRYPLYLGYRPSGNLAGTRYVGKMDDIRIYNRALSSSEVLQLYNSGVPAAPAGMALIPAGSFTMGNSYGGEGGSDELPLHSVYVSAFYMDRYEVTRALWEEVYNWAITHSYNFEYGAQGKAFNHPAHSISWFDAIKWCNARSEKEGKTPAYYTDAGLSLRYRNGRSVPSVNWNSGYRLSTEAEWEKAARGGLSGRRFPWSDVDTILHSRANYFSDTAYIFDTSLTHGHHPSFQDGVQPYTSPVGSFAPNAYGLYDMAGNLREWCWDWYLSTYYSTSPASDPRGPPAGSMRVHRGGSWTHAAPSCRAAHRNYSNPPWPFEFIGFRCVLPASQ